MMRPSEILRTTKRKQIHNKYFASHGGVCAVGAINIESGRYSASDLPYRDMIMMVCPGDCSIAARPYLLESMMIHLNDDHMWNFWQIADWLEAVIEPVLFAGVAEAITPTVTPAPPVVEPELAIA